MTPDLPHYEGVEKARAAAAGLREMAENAQDEETQNRLAEQAANVVATAERARTELLNAEKKLGTSS